MNKYKRYRERRDASIVANLQQRLGPDVQLPQSHREFTYLNRIKNPGEQAQEWARVSSCNPAKDRTADTGASGSTGSVTPTEQRRKVSDLNSMHPSELPRKLKVASTLYVLKNLGRAFDAITERGDEDELLMLERILAFCRDQRSDEMQSALYALAKHKKERRFA